KNEYTMFGLFTKNLDTMQEATNKRKNLKELEKLSRLTKEEMGEFLGGNERMPDKSLKGRFLDWFSPSPCRGDLPQ
ncbi:MAG: hypothetical protein RI973_987, partial [Bacteroidota bacterium]